MTAESEATKAAPIKADAATRETAVDLLRELKRVTSGASTFAEQREVWHRVDEFLAQFTPGTVTK